MEKKEETSYQAIFSDSVNAIEDKLRRKIQIISSQAAVFLGPNSAGKGLLDINFSEEFNDDWAKALINIIQDKTNPLYSLKAMNVSMNDEQIERLAPILAMNKTIKILDLQWNPLTDKGFKAIADMLAENDTLDTVYLGKPNKMTREGVEYLAKKVAERKHKYPDLKAEIDFTEVSQAGDKDNLDKIYRDTLKAEEEVLKKSTSLHFS